VNDNFYFILKGKVKIFKLFHKIAFLTAAQYFDLLILLQNDQMNFGDVLLLSTININQSSFEIDMNQIKNDIKRLIFKLKLRKLVIAKAESKEIYQLFLDFNQKLESFLTLKEMYLLEDNANFLKEKFQYLEKDHVLIKYQYYFNQEKKKLKLLSVNNVTFTKTGGFIEDQSLLKDNFKKQMNVICASNCHLGVVNYSTFKNFILPEKMKNFALDIDYLHKNFFFTNIELDNLSKFYTNNFFKSDYKNNEFLFREGSDKKFIYLIREGKVQLSISCSIMELINILKKLSKSLNININYDYDDYGIFH
jgi:hypothetical protein